jgi:hypothetical protein
LSTKWRKTFTVIADTGIKFRVALVSNHKYGLEQVLRNSELNETHIGDGCIVGGPIEYKEIFGLQVARYESIRNPQNGANYKDEAKSIAFKQAIESLGMYPIEVTEEHIYIHGYEQ